MKRLYKEYIKLEKELKSLVEIRNNKILLNYAESFRDIDNKLAEVYRKYANKQGQIDMVEFKKYLRMKKLNAAIEGVLISTFNENKKVTRSILRNVATESYKQSINIVNEEKKWSLRAIQKPLDVTKTINEEVAGYKWAERMNRNRKEVIGRVQQFIRRGIENGETYNSTAAQLSKELEVSMNKATRIVRTESHRVINQSKQESFEDMGRQGARIKKQWLTAQDERVRGVNPEDNTNHIDMDGQVVDVDADFILPDGIRTKAPGLSGVAGHDINCRCIQILLIE